MNEHWEIRKFETFTDSGWRRSTHCCYIDWMWVENVKFDLEAALLEEAKVQGVSRNLLFAREVGY